MRADRLIRLLLLLKRRQRVTAAEVAIELEVSERTARRDLEALSMSGVPLYSTHGRARNPLRTSQSDSHRALEGTKRI